MSTWQKEISDSVKARGYVQGDMTQSQYAFNQFLKSIEELAEVGSCFGTNGDTYIVIRELNNAAHYAKHYFNSPERMGKVTLHAPTCGSELADVLITLVMAADVLGIDLQQMAIDKARGDVVRGIRENPDTISP